MEMEKVPLTNDEPPAADFPTQQQAPHVEQPKVVYQQPVPAVVTIAAPPLPEPPYGHIILAVITIFFFCWPCGLVALVHGLHARNQFKWGEYTAAEATNKLSKKWSIIGIVCAVIFAVIVFVVVVLANVIPRVVLSVV